MKKVKPRVYRGRIEKYGFCDAGVIKYEDDDYYYIDIHCFGLKKILKSKCNEYSIKEFPKFIVYAILNLINEKIYVGITEVTLEERFRQHISASKRKENTSSLYTAMRELGCDKFYIVPICSFSAPSLSSAKNIEKICINVFNSVNPNGYNQKDIYYGNKKYKLWFNDFKYMFNDKSYYARLKDFLDYSEIYIEDKNDFFKPKYSMEQLNTLFSLGVLDDGVISKDMIDSLKYYFEKCNATIIENNNNICDRIINCIEIENYDKDKKMKSLYCVLNSIRKGE